MVDREDRVRRSLEIAKHATHLLTRGASLRGAARLMGISYDELRHLVRKGRGGQHGAPPDPRFAELAQAAAARSARAPRRKPSGPFVPYPSDGGVTCAGAATPSDCPAMPAERCSVAQPPARRA
jgi:hypothetical protein